MKWLLIVALAIFACSGQKSKPKEKEEVPKVEETMLNIEVKDYGTIKIEIFPEQSPRNVANVVKLCKKGFYDGLIFHRVVPGFVIQGGCPKGDGTGNPGYTVDDEILSELKHERGTVAMANCGPNTNGCQFYICLTDLPKLDGKYTIIGKVVEGMAVVDSIAKVKTRERDRPLKKVIMKKVWAVP